jgi:sulfofructose kinase
LASWGLRVAVAGNFIGADRKADLILKELERYERLDTRYIIQHPNLDTPFTRVFVDPYGERSRVAYWYDQTPKDELLASMMARARILSVDAYGKAERDRAAQVARSLGRPVISADAIWPQYPLAGLSTVVVISSAFLLASFPGVYEYDHALDLQARGAGVVIITDGPKAVLVVREDGSPFGVEPYEVRRVVDTSGAGDLFKAGLIYAGLQEDWPLEQKVKFACAAAGLNCERDRSKDPPPSLADIFALMKRQPR